MVFYSLNLDTAGTGGKSDGSCRAAWHGGFPVSYTHLDVYKRQILKCSDPKQIKALGRKVRGFDQKVWDKFKYAIVLNGNWCKFSQNRNLREFLLSTGDSVLVETSPYDNIWGIRLSANSPEAQDPMKWRGQNLLGFALMEVRDELRRVTQNEMLCDWNAV